MRDTAPEFHNRHQSIINALKKIEESMHSFTHAKACIHELQTHLLQHYMFQDDLFFEQLTLFFSQDDHTIKLLEFIKIDLHDKKVKTLTFFDKHSFDGFHIYPGKFMRDFDEFAKYTMERVRLEQERLLPLLEKLFD
jgi:hypothetical protein